MTSKKGKIEAKKLYIYTSTGVGGTWFYGSNCKPWNNALFYFFALHGITTLHLIESYKKVSIVFFCLSRRKGVRNGKIWFHL
jgi:hypothetical protein